MSRYDDESMARIENASPQFIKEAMRWWNKTADSAMKRFIIVVAYHETLNAALGNLDNELRDLDNDDQYHNDTREGE